MEVPLEKAVSIFERLQQYIPLAPSLHPHYVALDAKRDSQLKPVFFIYEEGNSVFYHGIHKSPIPNTDLFDLQSPYGYGGPVFFNDHPKFREKAITAYTNWCKSNRILVEFVRFHPLINNASCYYGEVFKDRDTVWIDLQEKDLLMSYRARMRTKIRKAQKCGLTTEWCAKDPHHAQTFINLYTDCMKDLNADPFYFFNENYFEELLSWPNTHLLFCKWQGEVVGGVAFLVNDDMMEYHLSASNSLGKQLGATNVIIHEAALFGQKIGCKTLHLGGGTDRNPDNSLFFYKTRFSSHTSSFCIGRYVIYGDIYKQMKADWQQRNPQQTPKILFYRF
jgi:hypothetical protein